MDLVWPEGEEFDDRAKLLREELPNLEAELNTSIRLVRKDSGVGPRWVCRIDPDHDGPAVLRRDSELIESVGRTHEEMWETFSLRHTWLRTGADASASDAADLDEAVDRIINEVGFTYPAFALRGLNWDKLCDHYAPLVLAADDPLAVCQEWVAQLGDAHTAVHSTPRHVPLPYAASMTTLVRVPEGSVAWEAGVRPGWRLHAPRAEEMTRRTGASPHMHPYLVGRRLLSGQAHVEAEWRAFGPDGADVTWVEAPTGLPYGDLVTWHRRNGVGHVRLKQWVAGAGIADALDEALAELADCEELALDLRGNVGGNVVLARATRDRFLHEETLLGSVRYSIGNKLSEPVPMIGCPADGARWHGRLTVLTDAMTYSASEDFLLGLQGLDHVRVVGEPSGGGSGRPRVVRLLPGWSITISTVLTYDRNGHCVENAGVPVDSASTSRQWR
ncbi:S41 family peptidase [Allokutzneria oryzae]|uniref:S41 family peptidase n=1 Tax=Allokutzneria oryzae TaxID=1378989 RepID=A0ABV6A7G7_9PSEU